MVTIPCHCPPLADGSQPHDEDQVELRSDIGFLQATSIRHDITAYRIALEGTGNGEPSTGEILAVLTEGYIIHGVVGWTLVDADGEPLPVSRPNIRSRLLGDWELASIVADAADDLYAEAVMLPLLAPGSKSSQRSRTDVSTSPSPVSGTPHRTQSSPSSTSTTPTGATGTTTVRPDGASRSSRKSATAA